MSGRRWTRFLPSRSKLALVAALLLIAWAGIAFLDLAAAKNQALTQYRQVILANLGISSDTRRPDETVLINERQAVPVDDATKVSTPNG